MSSVNEPPGIQDSQMNDSTTKLTSNGVNGVSENGEFKRSDHRRSSSKKSQQLHHNDTEDKLCNGTVNPAFLGDSDDQLTSNKTQNPSKEEPPNPNYLVNEDDHLKGVSTLNDSVTTTATKNGSTPRIIDVPEDALLNHHSARIRLKKKEAANNKENEAKNEENKTKTQRHNDKNNSVSVIIPMNGVLHNGDIKEKGEKETTMTVSENSQRKVKDGVPVSSPLTSEKTAQKKSEEYFIPANTHKKFLRGEKLYLTNEKRKGGCSWKKVAISGCLLAVLAAAVLIGVLAATGILPVGQSEMFTASSPTLELPAQASVSMQGHDDSVLPLTSSATTDRPKVTTISPRRRTTLLSATRQPTSATNAPNLVSQLPIVTTQAPVIVPYVLRGDLTVVNRNLSETNSDQYENLRTELEAELRKVFNDTNGFINVNVTRLQAGSIKVQFVTSFANSKYDPREIQRVIQAYLDKHNGYLDRFLVDPESVAVKIPKNECEVNNGGCTDICTWDSSKYLKTCSCSGEKILQSDHLTCLIPTEAPVAMTQNEEVTSTAMPLVVETETMLPTTVKETTKSSSIVPVTKENRALLSPETTVAPETTTTLTPETTSVQMTEVPTTTTSKPVEVPIVPLTVLPDTTTIVTTLKQEPDETTVVSTTEVPTTSTTTLKPETTVSEVTTVSAPTIVSTEGVTTLSDVPIEINLPEERENVTTTTSTPEVVDTVPNTVSDVPETSTVLAVTHSSDRGDGRSFTGNETEVTMTPEVTSEVSNTVTPDRFAVWNVETTEKTSTLVPQFITEITTEPIIIENLTTVTSENTEPVVNSITVETTTTPIPATLQQDNETVKETTMFISPTEEELMSTTLIAQETTSPSVTKESLTTTVLPNAPSELIIIANDSDTTTTLEPSSSTDSISTSSTVTSLITSSEENLTTTTIRTTESFQATTEQAENTRSERNSEPTPSELDDVTATFVTEINRPSENGTILSSILENDATNSSNDFSTEVGDEMVNVDTEITTTVQDEIEVSDNTTVLNATTAATDFDMLGLNETLTTESFINDTLVDEFANVTSDDFNTTKVIEDDPEVNETTDFTMMNVTVNDTVSHEELTSASPNTTTMSDVVSISGRRLDDDSNSTFTYDDDFALNVTAYDGLVYMNDTEEMGDNSTIVDGSFKFDNETTTDEPGMILSNETAMIDDAMTSGQPHVTNASIIEGCENDEFRCSNDSNTCLKKKQICDGFVDCPDGFDESDCLGDCGFNFLCANSSAPCIKAEARCDGIVDCDDGSDEEECGGKAYCDRIQQVSCSDNSYCIKPLEICDGHYNCLDRSDERDCVDRSACQASGSFFCNDNLCLPPGLRCDGIKDCQQGEDEENCKCNNTVQFECPNGECLSLSKRCDGSQDCNDGSDEMECFKVDTNGVIHVLDGPSRSWGLLCDDPDYPWSLDGGHELCQELGFSAAQSIGQLRVAYSNASHYHQWLPYLNSSTGYWLANTERRNSCYSDALATVTCVKYECGDLKHEDGSRKKVEQWPFITTIRGEERESKDQNWDNSRVRKKFHVCRADIITPLWLITSVGCLTELTENHTDWEVRVQQVELLTLTICNNLTQTRKVKSVLTHPHSSVFRSLILYDYDMALVRLEKPLKFGNNMAAVCLPDEEVKPGITCFTSSFNTPEEIEPNKQLAAVHYMTMMVEERDTCNEGEHYNGGVGERMLCTKNKEVNHKLCKKDTAASLSCISINEKWYLAGILSYQRYCEAYKKHPAVYANIHAMRNYIEKVVGMKMYNVSEDQNITYLAHEHDAAYINNPDLSANSVRPLEPYSTYSNETLDSNVTYPSSFDEFGNFTTTEEEEEENGTMTTTEMGVDLFTTVPVGSRNENETESVSLSDDSQSNDTVTEITTLSSSNETVDPMQFEAVEFDTNMTSSFNVSSYSMDDGALNSIDLSNGTSVPEDNGTLSETMDPLNVRVDTELEEPTTPRVPKPITVYDSETSISPTTTTVTELALETTRLDENLNSTSSDNDSSTNSTTTGTITDENLTTTLNPNLGLAPEVTSTRGECEGDVFKCLSNPSCVPSETVCDGVYHCPDQSDEWSCLRLNQSTSILEIRDHSFGWSTICSDNWTGDLSHKVCHQLGYPSALLTDHIPLRNDSMDMLLQVTDPTVKLVQGAVSANETADCAKREVVSVTCSEYQCGLWSLKTEDSDTSEGRQGRKVGTGGTSTAARDGEWPSMAILRNGVRTCAASILSKRWLLATWSCLRNNDGDEVFTPFNWTAVTGTSTSGQDEQGPYNTHVDTILPHPSANVSSGDCGENDVALVRLSTTLSFGRFASAVCLPQTSFRPRELCVVAAWEKLNDRSSLYYQPVNTLANGENECNSTSLETEDILCPGLVESPTFTQQNEPGAALMCINQSHHWELHGIASAHNNCHRNVTYSNVYSHSKWIASTIKEN